MEAKGLANKTVFSTKAKDIEIAKNKVFELSKSINHLLKSSDLVVQNQKRIQIEVERLDTIAFRAIKDLPDVSKLKESTRAFTPLRSARDEALQVMQNTLQHVQEARQAISKEQVEHRDSVEEMKREIKQIKASIAQLATGTHSMQVTFETDMSDRRSARVTEIKTRRQAIHDEIGTYDVCDCRL